MFFPPPPPPNSLLRSLAANKDVRAFDEPATLSAYEMPAYRSAVELLGLEADEVEDVREETLEAQEAEDGEAAGVSGTAESEPEAEQSSPQQEEAAAEPVAEAAAAGSQVAMATATEATAATEPPAPAAPAARTASAHNFATVREAKTELSRIMGISVHSSSELSGTEVKGELHRASTRYVCHSCKSGVCLAAHMNTTQHITGAHVARVHRPLQVRRPQGGRVERTSVVDTEGELCTHMELRIARRASLRSVNHATCLLPSLWVKHP